MPMNIIIQEKGIDWINSGANWRISEKGVLKITWFFDIILLTQKTIWALGVLF